jgi:hypothetical protein
MNPLRPRNWIISGQRRWQYLWSISISPGMIPNSRRRKKRHCSRDKFRAGNKWSTKIGDPRSTTTICISVSCHWFMDHRKMAGIQSIFLCILRLSGIDWCHSLTVSYRLPAANTLQGGAPKLKLKLFAGIMLLSGQMKMRCCCWSEWQ